jgi:DNA polymerase-3 subunit delta
MPVIVLAGEEEFRIAREVETLGKRLVDPAWSQFNFQKIDSPDIKDVVDAAATLPFGPGNKVIVFEHCALFTKKRAAKEDDAGSAGTAKDKSAKVFDDLDAALQSVSPATHLIFSCVANFDSTLKVSKVVAKHAELRKFDKVKYFAGAANRELLDFCNKEAHRFDACIDDDAAFYLAESTEVDLRQISSEISKAATYILPEKTIRLEHVTTLSPHYSQVFSLMEHWAAGRRRRVLTAIKELQARQISPHMVLAAAQTVIAKWLGYKIEVEKACGAPAASRDVRRKEVPLNEIAKRIAFEPRLAFIVEQDLKRIRSLTLEYLVRKRQELTDLEYLLKSGQMPEAHALEHFFVR